VSKNQVERLSGVGVWPVNASRPKKGEKVEVTFENCALAIIVEPLISSILDQRSRDIKVPDKVLWHGYYLAVIEPAADVDYSRVVGSYFSVVSQKLGEGQFSDAIGSGGLEDFDDELCKLI
jgi:hypothetical protein